MTFEGPGYAAIARVDRGSGGYTVDVTTNDLVTVMNDLHKGRHTGWVWSWVIDVSAVVGVLVSLTGLVLVFFLRLRRRAGLIVAAVGCLVLWVLYEIARALAEGLLPPGSHQSPRQVPTRRAVRTKCGRWGETSFLFPATSSSGTGSIELPWTATITLYVFSRSSSAQRAPNWVARIRSPAEGVPPRCRWPRIVSRDSSPVSSSRRRVRWRVLSVRSL